MKEKKQTSQALTWFERIWERVGLVNTNPELAPYLDVDKWPRYQVNVIAKLIGQGLPLTPPKELKTMTPKKLGLLLGQQCATLYALGEYFQSLQSDVEAVERGKENVKALRTQRHLPGVSSALHSGRILGMMIQELVKYVPRFQGIVHGAFKGALDQPKYQEALEFFQGFATGLSKPGFKDGTLVRPTRATPLQMKMFMHPEQVAEMKNVRELRAFLLKSGFTEETLGDDERLQKFCTRLGYAPGKRGRPPPPFLVQIVQQYVRQ
jgi:hypothetical protein